MNTQRNDSDGKPATSGDKTPNTDMQPEDTGTADSGTTGAGNERSEADKARAAMKQTSKTGVETGSKR